MSIALDEAVRLLQKGEVVAFPTETVYGLGADAWDPDAIRKIYRIKGRPADNPLIIHLHHPDQVHEFASQLPREAEKLMSACWPGPLTLILPKKPEVPDILSAGLPTVALRIPRHPLALELIRRAGPLAAPSANLSGRPSPTRAEHVFHDLGSNFPLLEGDEGVVVGLESSVLDLTRRPPALLRPGAWSREQLEEIAGVPIVTGGKGRGAPASPGVKYTHYKPEAKVEWWDGKEPDAPAKTLLITHADPFQVSMTDLELPHHLHFARDYGRMAHELFDLFRSADRRGLTRILIEPLPGDESHPLVAALRNRIDKATGNRNS